MADNEPRISVRGEGESRSDSDYPTLRPQQGIKELKVGANRSFNGVRLVFYFH